MPETGNKKRNWRPQRFWSLAAEYAEPVVASIAGLVLAGLGFTGGLSGDELAAGTLLVLSLLAFSLLRERLLRIETKDTVEALDGRLDEATDAINALQSGNPYSVLSHETTWDIAEPDGSLAYATRLKKIRIDQNNVFALYDFASGDGTRENEYSPGEVVSEFFGEGRMNSLVALGRIYYRGERLDFNVKRTIREGFMDSREAVTVETHDATERMRLKILWPEERPPTAIRLGRATASHDWKTDDVSADLKTENGRPVYEVEIHGPEKGGVTTIEWDWEPIAREAEAPGDAENSN